MDPVITSDQIRAAQPQSGEQRRPFQVLVLIVGILAARWIWIAGLGDYAWTYELGMRIRQGEIPYRDYISALPQLTSYTIVPFIVLLKGNLWSFSLHLYAWWFATLLVGLQVARAFKLRPAAQAAALFLAACLSLPATHLGHAYSYAGTFFFGLTLLQIRRYQVTLQISRWLLAGVFAGLGLLAKQNIGMVSVLLGMAVLVFGKSGETRQPAKFLRWLAFCVGISAAFLPAFAYFSHYAGTEEVFQQMFSDAGAGKGGLFSMLFHILPFFFFTPQTPFRDLWILLFGGGLALTFLGFLGNKLHRLRTTQPDSAPAEAPAALWGLVASAIGVVAFLAAISLLDLPGIRGLANRLHPKAIYEFHGFVAPLVFVAYSFLTALAAICLLSPNHRKQPEYFLPIIALPLLLWGHEISCQGYLPFGAPVIIPLAVVLLEKSGLIRNAVPTTCIAGVVLMLGVAASTQDGFQPPNFKATVPLPAGSKFTGLRATSAFAHQARELIAQVTPRIQGQRTLWICTGGPHLAWGGKSVFSVACLFGDTYNVRSEPALLRRWEAQPPEFIFVGQRTFALGSQIFTPAALNAWLPKNYEPVWQNEELQASLWQLRRPTNPATP